ncbi:glycosyltransferase family 4 protein [Melittangium boletus]|uniref:Glycosyl transferase family 1 n=1 Tax=Melittangium boletus DSM 14713 TaxID=1294270 RepID=A0A250ICM2_9BACT|nr:glycosyltransferase family 4 protein [Melittangium boletus]ATB28887.1 glycosyl transferase family 1 [Melittangium boletus DSM 14713]
MPPVQRVLMTADTVGGVWAYALELSRALAERGVRVELATLGAPLSAAQWREARDLPELSIHESHYRLEWMEEPWDDVRASGEWLLDLEARLSPDIVHLNGFCHGALAWRAPALVVAHSCVLSWWEAVKREPAPERYARYRREVGRGLRAAACVVAPGAAMLAATERLHGPLRASRVIPNARRAEAFRPGPKEDFVLAAGRLWDEAKNLAALDAVAPGLPFPVWVAGETQHPGGGSARAPHVRSLGTLAPWELAGWMGRAAVYAMPARYEPFGLSILEAALAGCALVLGDIPSLRELWGDAARFVHPDDEDGLADALRGLMRHRAQREGLAVRARSRALTFTPRRMVEAYLELYATLNARPSEAWARSSLQTL